MMRLKLKSKKMLIDDEDAGALCNVAVIVLSDITGSLIGSLVPCIKAAGGGASIMTGLGPAWDQINDFIIKRIMQGGR